MDTSVWTAMQRGPGKPDLGSQVGLWIYNFDKLFTVFFVFSFFNIHLEALPDESFKGLKDENVCIRQTIQT